MIVTSPILETATNYVDNLGGVALFLIGAPEDLIAEECNVIATGDDDATVAHVESPAVAETLWQTSAVCARLV